MKKKTNPSKAEFETLQQRASAAWDETQRQARRLQSNMQSTENAVHHAERTLKQIEQHVQQQKKQRRAASELNKKSPSSH